MFKNTNPAEDNNIDRLAKRVDALRNYELVSIQPLLALVEEMLDDARRQYDHTAAAVLSHYRERLISRLEEGVDKERWLSVPKAANLVDRPEGTVRYWCRRGLVDARKIGARDWKIDRDSLLRRAA